MNKLSY